MVFVARKAMFSLVCVNRLLTVRVSGLYSVVVLCVVVKSVVVYSVVLYIVVV